MATLQTSILQTLAYFDIFSYPLTLHELHRFLWQPTASASIGDMLSEVETLKQNNQILEQSGYFLLPGREEIIRRRQRAIPFLEEKLHRAKKAIRKLRFLPFIQAVFLCNTVAVSVVKKDSDIDVLIVVRRNRLWITRFLVTALLSVSRERRTKRTVANRICLSFYLTDDHLNISDITLVDEDIYLHYWITQLIPLYERTTIGDRIHQENQWVRQTLPYAFQPFLLLPRYRVIDSSISRPWAVFWEKLWGTGYGTMIEQQAKAIQRKKMERNYGSLQDAPDTRVVINDTMLKFHENDRRAQYRDQWKETIDKLLHC